MRVSRVIHLAVAEIRSSAAEETYLATGLDYTKPMVIAGTINEKCNYRCPMCVYWRPDHPRAEELTIEQWKDALASLKEFLGRYMISFAGGEPFVKPGFLELLEFCRDRGISFTVITNGSLLLRGDTIKRLVATRPVHLNISVDGATAQVHDRSRGVSGSLDTIERTIRAIRDQQEKTGVRFPIRIKPTVHAWNFRSMPHMARWVRQAGADTVDFEPVRHWTPEVTRDLWVSPNELTDLKDVVAQLVAQKRSGEPIETSEHRLLGMPEHFANRVVEPEVTPCRVGLRRFSIAANGDVTTCWFYDPIGNVREHSARDIWLGAVARKRRQETVACERACAYSCMTKRPFKNLIERGWLLLTADRRRSAGSAGRPIREVAGTSDAAPEATPVH